MRDIVLLSASLLIVALGCGDGIGQPIVQSTSASGGAGRGSAGALSGAAGTLIATGGSAGTTGGAAGTSGGASGFGGTAGRRFDFDPPWEDEGPGGRGGPDWEPEDTGPAVPTGSYCEPVSDWDERWETEERELFLVLNFAREAAGSFSCDAAERLPAPPLSMRAELRCAARLHSRDMSSNDYFDHVNQALDGPEDRIRATGYEFGVAGESIAKDDSMVRAAPSEVLLELFAASASDCKNLMDPRFEEIGIGRFENLWTLDFAGR